MANYKIGIDIGGTRTHAVLWENKTIIANTDVLTTDDTKISVTAAINQLLSYVNAEDISAVMIGTTRFVNNILQQKNLNKVFAIRLGSPASTAISPASDWPPSLKNLIGDHSAIISGGYEFTGNEITPFNPAQVQLLADQAVQLGISCIAVSGIFCNINPHQENEVYKIFKKTNPNFRITLSHQIGSSGLIARENATILNAALSIAFDSFCQGIRDALFETKLFNAKLFFSSNNGTIEKSDSIFPVQTYGSGPSNSIRGASLLYATESDYFIVADVGGTSTDIGINHHGFPVPAGSEIKIGDESEGFVCNFPSPLTFSCALGGGSIISEKNGEICIGPESVGHELENKAISFGGTVLTVTDIAIAKSRIKNFGNQGFLKRYSLSFINEVDDVIHKKLATMINSAVPYVDTKKSFPAVIVGGGSVLFDLKKLKKLLVKSIDDVSVVSYSSCASAVGASIAKVSGQFSKIYQYDNTHETEGISRSQAIKNTKLEAVKIAITKGANPESLKELGTTETPLSYLPGALHSVKVEVIGDFRYTKNNEDKASKGILLPIVTTLQKTTDVTPTVQIEKQFYEDMASGAALLGSGGGGDTYLSEVMLFHFLNQGKKPKIIELESVEDNMTIVAVGAVGAPSVGHEKLFSHDELLISIKTFEEIIGVKIDAIVPGEGAGFNAIYPLSVTVANNLPIINADCIGRALPELHMNMPHIYGKTAIAPIAVLSNGQNTKIVKALDFKSLEFEIRTIVTQLGGSATVACIPMTGKQAKLWCVPNTLSFCSNLGVALRSSSVSNRIAALTKASSRTGYGPIKSLGSGKIIELNRDCKDGFNRGWVIIECPIQGKLKIEFQNENLRASNSVTNTVLALVPDIITLLDIKGKAIPCELLRVGLEVSSILTIGVPKLLKTPQALAVIGPEQFNLQPLKSVRSAGITMQAAKPVFQEESKLRCKL